MATTNHLTDERLQMLAHVAELYFIRGLNQAQIAAQTSYSRSMISRLLTEAREHGIVEIRIHHPLRRSAALEHLLQSRFGLEHVRVLERHHVSDDDVPRQVGALAARLLGELVQDDTVIGVSWGSALLAMTNALREQTREHVHVVQMIGSLGTRTPEMDGADLARRIARAFNATYSTLPAPLIVSDVQTRNGLLRDERIREVLAQVRRAQLALVGIGSVRPEHSALVRAGFLKPRQLLEIARDAHAVGDVCAIPFDVQGNLLDLPIGQRVVGVDAATLTKIPLRIGVAYGEAKVLPVLGALRGGLVNTLVTDESTAMNVLRRSDAVQ